MQTNLRIAAALVLSLFINLTSAQTPNWKNIGPIPFPKKTIGQVHGIGRCSQIKFHATDPNKMYVASASGGLYQSNDKGLNWNVLGTDQITRTGSASIAVNPTNDQVIYWGTGDANYYSTGVGVYKTTNGGASWTASNSGMGNRLVIDMIFLPTDNNTIIAATNNGIYKSTDAGANWVLKSAAGIQFQDICYKPGTNGQIVYAAAAKSFYRSVDAGETWTQITSPAFVFGANGTRVSVCEADPSVVYVAHVGANTIGEIYKSTDGGSTFTNMRPASDTNCIAGYSATGGGQGGYNFDIDVNPADPNEIYLCAHLIWRSTDGGVTWVQQQKSWAGYLHTDQHQILFDPYVSGQLWNANDGGVWSNTANGTGNWATKSDGIAATEVYYGAISKANRNIGYIGTQDNGGFYYYNGSFYNDRGGDYGPSMWFDYSGYYYAESTTERRFYPSGSSSSTGLPELPSYGKFTFIPGNKDIGYHASAQKIYRCTNLTSANPSWTLIYTTPLGKTKDLKVDPDNPDRLYVFTDGPALYRSDDAMTAASFVQTALPATATSGSIAPIPNSDVIYLGQGSGIYRSADKGATWKATNGFPGAKVVELVADEKSTNEAIYASYALGVYYKDNTKPSWINYAAGLPIICGITDMDIYNDGISKGVLNVYYYGRGTWQTDLVPPPSNITVAITSPASNTTYSAPATINLSAAASASSGNITKVEFYNGTTLIGTSTSSPYTYSWSGVSSGTYALTAVAYDNLGNKKSSDLVTITVNFVCNKATGTPFGTTRYAAGSEFDKAFDGDTNTAFDAQSANSGYTGLDLGAAKVVTNIRYYPRSGNAGRMAGGKFQGSNVANFSSGVVDLYTIPTAPNYAWQDVSIPNSIAYRYYRYLSPSNGYCNVAEIEFCASNALPTVNITAPLNNTLYSAVPANINITATASDPDGSISKVEFYQGGTLIGTAASSPYSFNWTGVPAGTYQLNAKAYDNLNAVAVSSNITVIVGNQKPTVSIISPDDYAVYTNPATINIYAAASDPDGTISKVEFYNGGTLLGTSTTSPYSYNWTNVPIGTYKLTAKAYDNNGGTANSSPITVNVVFSCTSLSGTPFGTSPYAAGSEYDKAFDGKTGTFFDATSRSSGYTGLDLGTAKVIKGIRFYPRGPYEDRMNGGKFQGSNVANFSSGVVDLYTIPSVPSSGWNGVTVSNATAFRYVRYLSGVGGFCNVAEIEFCGLDSAPPTVTITAPANGAAYLAPATINIAANVTGSVSKVEFYIGASLIGTATNSPYNYNWTGVGAGTYNLIAKAYDNTGAVISSAPVNFTVNDKNNNNNVPTVSITAPANNAMFIAPATFVISATANDTDGNIDKVEFYNGTTLLSTSTTSPYAYTWSNAAAGTYTLTARAYDNDGAVTTSSAVSVRVNQPPTVSITAPANNAIYTAPATFAISATANDTDGNISKVEFYNGTALLGTVNASPYTFNWNNVAAGTYTLTAKAYDNNDVAATSSAVSVRVNQPPTVSIIDPANNSSYIAPATFDVSATANDSDGTISKVEFYNGVTLLATAYASPYTFNWNNVAAGTYTLIAKAYDNNNVVTISYPIEIKVNTLVNQSPSVSITSPANNAVFIAPATITINADATDPDGTISKVEFYNGTTLLSTSTTSPYTYTWNNVAAGSYEIMVKAFDNDAEATSSVVNVVVNNNQPPSASITSPANNTVFIAPASITIDALAEDSDGTISKVEFYNGTTLLSTSIGPRYTYSWDNVVAGSYAITVKSYDNLNAATTSSVVNVVVNNSNNNQFPTVSITSPANNTVFIAPASITIDAVAADSDGTISKVEFYNGTTLLSTSTTSPYTYTWNNVAAGTYAITAKSYDDLNATATSPVVNVIVNNNNQPPSASIISPANNTVFIAPASITIDALAEDSDGTISKVEFYNGTTLLSTSITDPYTYTWNNVAAGTYALIVKAYDNNDVATTSSAVSVRVNQPPTVNITAPANNAVYAAPATFAITATVNDADGNISKVEFYNGAVLLGTVTASPYTYTWTNAAAGTYILTAKVYDNDNATATSSSITVIVNNAPTVSITAPANNSSYTAPAFVTITATASDTDGSVNRVEFYNGINLIATSTTTPYTCNLTNLPAGAYSLTAKVYDDRGTSTASSPIAITVNTPVNQSPSASITSPANNTTFIAPTSITINAIAADSDGTISKVEFYNGATLLSTSTTSPYKYTWNNVAAGTYALTVKSYDNLNTTATSSVVNVVVNNNQVPTVRVTSPANNTAFIAPASVTINAVAADSDGTISKVEFYNGATLLSTSTTSPYTYTWNNVAAGTYQIVAKATDNTGNVTSSTPVTIVVKAKPIVSMISPSVNDQVVDSGSDILFNFNVTDPDRVLKSIIIKDNGVIISTLNKSPYSFTLTNMSSGDNHFTAAAVLENGTEYTFASLNIIGRNCKSEVWNASTDYLIGDQVIYQNSIYRALVINTNKQPDQDSSIWSKIGTCENQGLEYSWARLYTLYPNPCTTYFNIKFFDCAGKSFYYRIVDISGRLIRDKSSESIKDAIFEKEVKIQGLSSGTYIVYIHIDEKVFSEKIIVVEKPSMYKKKK